MLFISNSAFNSKRSLFIVVFLKIIFLKLIVLLLLVYRSFCEKHKPRQEIPVQFGKKEKMNCVLCCHRIIFNSSSYEEDFIWPDCCKPKALLHKKCLQVST